MSDLKALEDWVAPLIERLSERERRQLAATIAREGLASPSVIVIV